MSAPRVWRERLARYNLEGGRCGACGKTHYPPQPACPYCGSRSISRVALPRYGRLVSYTVTYNVSEEARSLSPVLVGLVDLGVTRVLAELTDADPGDLRSGMMVEGVLRKVYEDGKEGLIVYGIKFRPSTRGEAG